MELITFDSTHDPVLVSRQLDPGVYYLYFQVSTTNDSVDAGSFTLGVACSGTVFGEVAALAGGVGPHISPLRKALIVATRFDGPREFTFSLATEGINYDLTFNFEKVA